MRNRRYQWFLAGPEHARYPQSQLLPVNAQLIGKEYVSLLHAVMQDQVKLIPTGEPISVALSGGADSTVVTTVLLEILRQFGCDNPVLATTLAIDGGGSDLPQAQRIAELLGHRHPNFQFQVAHVNSSDLDFVALKHEAALTLEEYHPRDVECGMAEVLLHHGLGFNDDSLLRYAFDGDGGNEIFQDYPREDQGYGMIPLDDVLKDPLLYLLGYERSKLAFNSVFSSGLSRAYTRTFNPARKCGVIPFSPLVDRRLVDFGQRLLLAQFQPGDLTSLRPEAVRLGIRSIFGLDLPAFPKARFQEGCCAQPGLLSVNLSESLKLKQLLLAQ
jgi:asparagine synthase (glutamine-hydrolysing)